MRQCRRHTATSSIVSLIKIKKQIKMMQRMLLKSLGRPASLTGQTQRAFASGTSFEKFNFEDPFKLD
jgi:hypothetical protein